MPADAEFCAECGAPLKDAPGVDGSDAEVYPELAKANLLRMRKDFKAAEDVCLSILRRFPNNHSANVLLGDIAEERGELDQAAEWYELALDIVPDSEEVTKKLETVRAQLAEKQVQTTVAQLGIPEKKPPVGLYAMIVLILGAFVVAAIVFANRKNPGTQDPNKPIVVNEAKSKLEPPQEPEKDEPVIFSVNDDLGQKIAAEAGVEGRTIQAAVGNPGGSIRLGLHAVGDDGEWPTRAQVVMAAFKLDTSTPKVELQYFKSTDPKGDVQIVERSTYERTQAADFDATDMNLLVETLFGHKMQEGPTGEGQDPENKTITPPMGEGGDGSADPGDAEKKSDASGG